MPTPDGDQTPTGQDSTPLDMWRAYIHTLQNLKGNCPAEYEKVPEILKRYSKENIENLSVYDVKALAEMYAIPKIEPPAITEESLISARAYIGMLAKLKGTPEYAKVPAVLRLSDDEIENLDVPHLQAYVLMNVFPATLFPQLPEEAFDPGSTGGPYRSHPYGVPDPVQTPSPQFPIPDISKAKMDHEIAKAIAQIGQLYNDGSAAILNSIFESNNKMGDAFRKAGG